ncbi:NADH:flavin oxidoreductase/NADH oxidase family protein [Halomonas sp. I5-271120]|uniref:NADH:flavin oxidoreductase/NADH oxidase family protein n=1 Tax=Halomonas sp. I5-271120 TaxID=3061632 RepID=UPI0027153C1A|nr:NADH:flavin oxidoreductase/NADH oxidase family protein [Halomonas sp. I5-271120]
MIEHSNAIDVLRSSLELPCGALFKNRIAKSAMSDSLGNGGGDPTEAQMRLYERWAEGGAAVSFIGEVQGDPRFAEKPGNLVLGPHSDHQALRSLTRRGMSEGSHLWAQLGHAGALAHAPISQPKGPSALDLEGLQCGGMSVEEIKALPGMYASTALQAKEAGFSGVHIHAGHGFLLSQFLCPLFNHRDDGYGGSIEARCRIVLDIIDSVRHAVGPAFPVGIRINSTDQLKGGLTEAEALEVVRMLDQTSIDLIDISGGTYFPGAKENSDSSLRGPYFVDFARRARALTRVPLMVTGGFKRREQALAAVASGAVDVVGLARAFILDPRLAKTWLSKEGGDPEFPQFASAPPGGVTAWYTLRLTALGEDRESEDRESASMLDLPTALRRYEERDAQRCITWRETFSRWYP